MFYHIYNEPLYRNPVGAVCEETEIRIKFLVSNEENVTDINLVCTHNDGEEYKLPMRKSDAENGRTFFSELIFRTKKGLYFYYFEVKKTDRIFYVYKDSTYDFYNHDGVKWQITSTEKNYRTPQFFKGKIMYHIFVDRFNSVGEVRVRDGFVLHENKKDVPYYMPGADGKINNEDIFGGNLRGIIEKLDYLKSLNVAIIYMSPIFEAASNHKYNTSDYMKIDDMFGDEAILEELIQKADSLGMKIILDGVFNHTGADSIYFNKYGKYDSIGAYQSQGSKYYDWYTFNHFNEDYECWWGVKSLPSIKKDQPVYRAFVCGVNGVIEKWLRKGIAGFRLDVADELSDRMLKAINRVTKEVSEENIIIGEVWEDASNKFAYGQRRQYLLGNQLDSVMNYPLKDGIVNFLRTRNKVHISNVMEMIINNYPKETVDSLMNILGTHDTMRILTALSTKNFTVSKDEMAVTRLSDAEYSHGRKLLFMAVLMQMTLPGFPCIYYGDEIGMQGYSDPFCRRFFEWENINNEINVFYKKITEIRTSSDIFTDGIYKEINLWEGIFFYKRQKDNKEVYICINLSDRAYVLNEENNYSLLNDKSITKISSDNFDIFIKK